MKLTWTPAAIGCYWSAGPFTIGTYHMAGGDYAYPGSGYELTRNREVIGRYPNLEAAQSAAERDR